MWSNMCCQMDLDFEDDNQCCLRHHFLYMTVLPCASRADKNVRAFEYKYSHMCVRAYLCTLKLLKYQRKDSARWSPIMWLFMSVGCLLFSNHYAQSQDFELKLILASAKLNIYFLFWYHYDNTICWPCFHWQ